MDVKIVDFPGAKVAALEHCGPPELEHESIRKFVAWRIENRLSPDRHRSYGVHYNDPRTVQPEDYRVDLCVTVNEDVGPNEYGIVNKYIPACRCATVRHLGSRKNVTTAAYLYDTWLPESGESTGEFPIFFHYVNVGEDIAEHEMITDVYLPLASGND